MNQINLESLYPEGYISSTPIIDDITLSLPYKQKWFNIPTETLSKTEINLLNTAFPKKSSSPALTKHLWFNYLFGDIDLPLSSDSYRVIHVYLNKTGNLNTSWLNQVVQLFNESVDAFFINDRQAYLIEKKAPSTEYDVDISSILQTLEDDFSISAIFFIGHFHVLNSNFKSFFEEETLLFESYRNNYRSNDIFSFQDIALNYLTKDKINDSALMKQLREQFKHNDELTLLIKTLWNEHGNITSTANQLFIHRNTLQYRLDKFYQSSGLSLKNMNDLALCYLLISSVTK